MLGGAVLTSLVAGLHLAVGAYLWAFASEGLVPPGWRTPDLPDGATIVREETACASGGCWREVAIDPAGDDTPSELAAAMGLTPDDRYGSLSRDRQGWRFLDPAAVSIHSQSSGGLLVVHVQYAGGLD
ncbi:hypothetical protein GCM10027215_11350 [Nocardioides zeae]